MTKIEVISILEHDNLIYTAAIHWNVIRSASLKEPPRIIYVREFIDLLASKITQTFDPSILNKKTLMHVAHWYTENMIREQYTKLVASNDNG